MLIERAKSFEVPRGMMPSTTGLPTMALATAPTVPSPPARGANDRAAQQCHSGTDGGARQHIKGIVDPQMHPRVSDPGGQRQDGKDHQRMLRTDAGREREGRCGVARWERKAAGHADGQRPIESTPRRAVSPRHVFQRQINECRRDGDRHRPTQRRSPCTVATEDGHRRGDRQPQHRSVGALAQLLEAPVDNVPFPSGQAVEEPSIERIERRQRTKHRYSAADGAMAATRARSPGLIDFGSNLRTFAAILVSASATDIGGAASFLRDGGTNRTGLMRATMTALRYGVFIPMDCIVVKWAATRSSVS